MREHTIYLVNTTCSPTRDQIMAHDVKVGDCFLKPLGLRNCGYGLVEGLGKHAAQWDLPADQINEAIDYVETHGLDGYEAQVWLGVEKVFKTEAGIRCQQFSRRFA